MLIDGLSLGIEALADVFAFAAGHRWALAIVVFTLLLRTILLPLSIKQTQSSLAMQRLKPEMDRLKKKYGGTDRASKERMAQEQQELFRREGVNPLGCMGPMLIQMPILFAMYRVMINLSKEHTTMPFLGLGNLADNAGTTPAGWILLVIMTLSSIVSSRQLSRQQSQQQQMTMLLMPLFFVLIMVKLPAGVVLYWTISNVFQAIQQQVMLKRAPETKELAKVDRNPTPKAPRNETGGKTVRETPTGRPNLAGNKRNRKRKR